MTPSLTAIFYEILVDDKPVYVGYTNRSIRERFNEHLRDKEFDSDNVTIKFLDKLSFDFTWDYNVISKYADLVSQKETDLIIQEKTSQSHYQKGFNNKKGGTTWTHIKWFVKTNRNNPKFQNLSEKEILHEIDQYNVDKKYLSHFIDHMQDPDRAYLSGFVSHMKNPDRAYLLNFVTSMKNPDRVYLSNFINNMQDPDRTYLSHFIEHMKDPDRAYLSNFVNSMKNPDRVYLSHFVNHMQNPDRIYLAQFVNSMKNPDKVYLSSFVNHMQEPDRAYLTHFVTGMKKHITC